MKKKLNSKMSMYAIDVLIEIKLLVRKIVLNYKIELKSFDN